VSIPELDRAQRRLKSQQEELQQEKDLAEIRARDEYQLGVKTVDTKIDNFIRVLRRQSEYRDTATGGISIDLGSQSNLETLPEVAGNYLGRTGGNPEEHIVVKAFHKDHKFRLQFIAVTGVSVTNRYIEVITVAPRFGRADMLVALHQTSNIEMEPKSVQEAYEKGIALSEKLDTGKKLIDFAIDEAARVMFPPQGH